MLWLLPREAGPVRVRLDPGVHVVPRWYDDAELGVLVELLRQLVEPTMAHALVLSADAIGSAAWAKLAPGSAVLLAIQGPIGDEQRAELGRWAREHRCHVLISARADEGELMTGWLEGELKPAVLWLLERGAWVDDHPLSAFGIAGLDPDAVARATEDPVEMLWLIERMLRHRLQYAAQGLGEQDYSRSLGHTIGRRCAEKLRRHGEGVTAALDVIVGSGRGNDGWAPLVEAGLGVWRDGAFVRGPLLRAVEADPAALDVIIGELGEEVLSEDAKAVVWARRRAEARKAPQLLGEPLNGMSSAPDGERLATALRTGLGTLVDPPELLGEVVDAIERWGEQHWNEERVQSLRALQPRLRGLLSTPTSAHRRFAWLELRVLEILATKTHDQLAAARASHEALRRLLGEPLEGWGLDVRLHATIECAKRHVDHAETSDDLEHAERLLREAVAVGEEQERPRHVADARWYLAVISMRRGELDEAARSLREEVLPVYEQLGDLRNRAHTMDAIAHCLQLEGALDQALDILRHEQLPTYERLSDPRSKAMTLIKIADILQAKGAQEQALRIREEQIPVFERVGDLHAKASTWGRIASTLQASGQLARALQIRQEEQLPVLERMGDARERAIALGKIANILRLEGEVDRALRIWQEQLAIFERLGDVREKAVASTAIAMIHLQQGEPAARAEASRLLSEAYEALSRLNPSEASTVLRMASKHGIELAPSGAREA